MRYPLTLSRTGFLEGMVELPRGVASATDLVLPPGERPAVYEAGKVGQEVDLNVDSGQAWVALQLEKSHRYWQHIRDLVAARKLALTPGGLPHLATKTAGIYTRLPLVEWHLWHQSMYRAARMPCPLPKSCASSKKTALPFRRPRLTSSMTPSSLRHSPRLIGHIASNERKD